MVLAIIAAPVRRAPFSPAVRKHEISRCCCTSSHTHFYSCHYGHGPENILKHATGHLHARDDSLDIFLLRKERGELASVSSSIDTFRKFTLYILSQTSANGCSGLEIGMQNSKVELGTIKRTAHHPAFLSAWKSETRTRIWKCDVLSIIYLRRLETTG